MRLIVGSLVLSLMSCETIYCSGSSITDTIRTFLLTSGPLFQKFRRTLYARLRPCAFTPWEDWNVIGCHALLASVSARIGSRQRGRTKWQV